MTIKGGTKQIMVYRQIDVIANHIIILSKTAALAIHVEACVAL